MSHEQLMDLSTGMWAHWQSKVLAALPHYARCNIYVNQTAVAPENAEEVVSSLVTIYDPTGATRDVPHGARVFETSRGPVTRQWLDGNIEIGFLLSALGRLDDLDVLDIGAGYGRLAAMLGPLVRSYTCVDAVPISSRICREYLTQYAPTVRVLDIAEFVALIPYLRPSLAINIHSWNECSLRQISQWLDALDAMQVQQLFTVTHGSDRHYYPTWEPGGPDFKPILNARWEIVTEESLGVESTPHVLWRRR